MTEGSLKNDVSVITDRGLWLRILKKTTHCCELVMGRMGAVWVGARGNGLSTCPLTYIDPRVWKAKIKWQQALEKWEMVKTLTAE